MRVAWLFAVCLGAVSAAVGLGIAVAAFEPIPFADSIDFYDQFFAAGGWGGYGLEDLYTRHNEHRLVVPRFWFLVDIALFDATQAFLIAVIVLSSLAHAGVLTLVLRGLGHSGPLLWSFAAAAAGAVLSPAQWENLVWGFQVQFVQVWLFATLAFVAVAQARGRDGWGAAALAVVAGLLSTYSMANGLLVWPLLVALALWCGVRGGPLWLLVLAAIGVVAIEAIGFQTHPGHGNPLETLGRPLDVLRYSVRYLTNAVGEIGSLGQEILGTVLVLAVLATAADAVLRPQRYKSGHAVLLVVAGFLIGAALLTALGRVTFGLGQANATRYATPSFLFLLTCLALALDWAARVGRPRLRAGAIVAAVAVLLVPGLVNGVKHVPAALGERDARVNAVVSYLAGGYRPAELRALFPFLPRRPYRVLTQLEERAWGPFAVRSRYLPPAAALRDPPRPSATCGGSVDVVVDDPVAGIVVKGWATAPAATEHPAWVLVTDATGRVVGWGGSRTRRDDVGAALGTGWGGRGFRATGPDAAPSPLSVVALFADGRSCLLRRDVAPRPPEFIADLPWSARPATGGAWTVLEGVPSDLSGPERPPDSVRPAVGAMGDRSRLLAVIDLPPSDDGAALAVPVRTRRFPIAVVLLVRDGETGQVIARHDFDRPSNRAWNWRVFTEPADPRFRGRRLRVELSVAGPEPWQGAAVGRPHWIHSPRGG